MKKEKIHFIDVFDLGPRGMGRYRAYAVLLTHLEMLYSSPVEISQGIQTAVMNVWVGRRIYKKVPQKKMENG